MITTHFTSPPDILIIGGGHAGIEAAAAACRRGHSVTLVTLSIAAIGRMSCNPAIGGLAKSQLVREVDALGGAMGLLADATAIQYRVLNRSKGPAVQATRTQNDRAEYERVALEYVRALPGLVIVEGEVVALEQGRGTVGASLPPSPHPPISPSSTWTAALKDGRTLTAKAIVLTAGTFLAGLLHRGPEAKPGGRVDESGAYGLSDSLRTLGLTLGRLKTGTPPRIEADSVDLAQCVELPGDTDAWPLSFHSKGLCADQLPCYQTRTTPATHAILRDNLDRSPLYSGRIEGVGPRYCPSVEDKVVKFPQRDSHVVVLEPEGRSAELFYVNGFSSSMPEEVQLAAMRTIPGLEAVRVRRYGYAVEYDYLLPTQLTPGLMVRERPGLFSAGQVNGTSGYEEAAAQGILAGINASRYLRAEQEVVIPRHRAYLGVLVDDLVHKGTAEPYRMFTSRAEHRLALREDNAESRLMPLGRELGLIDDVTWARYSAEADAMDRERERWRSLRVRAKGGHQTVPLWIGLRVSGVRPEDLFAEVGIEPTLGGRNLERLLIEAHYEGYLARSLFEAERLERYRSLRFPRNFDFGVIVSLGTETREKLARFRPATIGEAEGISGITPADLALMIAWLKRR